MNKTGVLLVNLGSPDSPAVPDVRKYLREFLMDGRVIDIPWLSRFLLVNCLILPFRPKKSAEAYHKIWSAEGSPLIVISKGLQQRLQERLPMPVELAMRYQNPSIPNALGRLNRQGVTETIVVPLFPHYAMSSYETAVVRVKEVAAQLAPAMTFKVLAPYYAHPDYISALTQSAAPYLNSQTHLLFSFHGIPERHLHKSDVTGNHCLRVPDCCEQPSPAHATCYRAQCFKTVGEFVGKSGVKNWSVAFQSRLGRDPWLKPYTDMELARLPQTGVTKLAVICPAFVSDCLETLEEIGLRGRETFLHAGGAEFQLVPCLNEHPAWVQALGKMILELTARA